MRTLARVLVAAVLAALATAACGPTIQSTCEQQCYGHRSNEPRDFDDCIRRCSR
jgi:hypothetical protein